MKNLILTLVVLVSFVGNSYGQYNKTDATARIAKADSAYTTGYAEYSKAVTRSDEFATKIAKVKKRYDFMYIWLSPQELKDYDYWMGLAVDFDNMSNFQLGIAFSNLTDGTSGYYDATDSMSKSDYKTTVGLANWSVNRYNSMYKTSWRSTVYRISAAWFLNILADLVVPDDWVDADDAAEYSVQDYAESLYASTNSYLSGIDTGWSESLSIGTDIDDLNIRFALVTMEPEDEDIYLALLALAYDYEDFTTGYVGDCTSAYSGISYYDGVYTYQYGLEDYVYALANAETMDDYVGALDSSNEAAYASYLILQSILADMDTLLKIYE